MSDLTKLVFKLLLIFNYHRSLNSLSTSNLFESVIWWQYNTCMHNSFFYFFCMKPQVLGSPRSFFWLGKFLLVNLFLKKIVLLKISLDKNWIDRLLSYVQPMSRKSFISEVKAKNVKLANQMEGLSNQQPSWHLLVQSQLEHQSNEWKLFRVINKDTSTMSMTLFWCLYCELLISIFSQVVLVFLLLTLHK